MTSEDTSLLRDLEESLWRSATRFNPDYMEEILAADFFEFGRSGRVYQRQDILDMPSRPVIAAKLPLASFSARLVSAEVALVTYVSEVRHDGARELANRSSVWCRTAYGWQITFHQGTPLEAEAQR